MVHNKEILRFHVKIFPLGILSNRDIFIHREVRIATSQCKLKERMNRLVLEGLKCYIGKVKGLYHTI